MFRTFVTIGAAVAGLALGAGCGQKPELGSVEGVVTLDGKPLARAAVAFFPDPAKGQNGPVSVAVTDDAGNYTLEYTVMNDQDPAQSRKHPGAVLGWHKVVIDDYQMYAEQLKPPGRVPVVYTAIDSTPLEFEVKDGPQTINLELKARKK